MTAKVYTTIYLEPSCPRCQQRKGINEPTSGRWCTDPQNLCEICGKGWLKYELCKDNPNTNSKVKFLQDAERDAAEAQYWLGIKYISCGARAVDYSQAAKWFCEAASRGHTWAQFELSRLYEQGQGVARDLVLAYALGLLVARTPKTPVNRFRHLEVKMTQEELTKSHSLFWSLAKPDNFNAALDKHLAKGAQG